MCWNMVAVTHHEGVLTKGLNRDNNQIWQFWPKIQLSASKWQIFAPAAVHRYAFEANHHQNVLFNSHNWRNLDHVTASKTRWRKQNFNQVCHGHGGVSIWFEFYSTLDPGMWHTWQNFVFVTLFWKLWHGQDFVSCGCWTIHFDGDWPQMHSSVPLLEWKFTIYWQKAKFWARIAIFGYCHSSDLSSVPLCDVWQWPYFGTSGTLRDVWLTNWFEFYSSTTSKYTENQTFSTSNCIYAD